MVVCLLYSDVTCYCRIYCKKARSGSLAVKEGEDGQEEGRGEERALSSAIYLAAAEG